MDLNTLTAISPIDGRYREKCQELSNYFSENALIRYRLKVEVEYFIALCELPLPQLLSIDSSKFEDLRKLYQNFTETEATEIKEKESITNHDVKALEYFLKERMEALALSDSKEFIHFALTSQDINNTAIPLAIRDSLNAIYYPLLDSLLRILRDAADEWSDVPMLARTHGQPASPTNAGKEILVFAERIEAQQSQLKAVPHSAKFGGATGNFNAHKIAYPEINWEKFADQFVNEKLGLKRSRHTTQIEHYDNFAAQCDALRRINVILIDMCRDIWTYISMEYFTQRIKEGEIGSSAMPHKVNPIDFENAEGNLGLANAVFNHLAQKLPISRLQRDLTDSTVLRNVGVPMAHTIIAFRSIINGCKKLIINIDVIKSDLENNWAVVAEAIQTILRREGFPSPYEALKSLTRKNEKINRDSIHAFIDQLEVNNGVKDELKKITPHNYTGIY
jgi:adenylosuccinate lyase